MNAVTLSKLCSKSQVQSLYQMYTRVLSTVKNRLPVLTLYTKDICPICDVAKQHLNPIKHKFQLVEVDITEPENKHWFDKYKYDIPVFHFEGEYLMKNKADIEALQRALKMYSAKEND